MPHANRPTPLPAPRRGHRVQPLLAAMALLAGVTLPPMTVAARGHGSGHGPGSSGATGTGAAGTGAAGTGAAGTGASGVGGSSGGVGSSGGTGHAGSAAGTGAAGTSAGTAVGGSVATVAAALYDVGYYYEHGIGVATDPVRAYIAYIRAVVAPAPDGVDAGGESALVRAARHGAEAVDGRLSPQDYAAALHELERGAR